MQVDWFTVGAQIVNFLVLVYLLKRFLYGPVVEAMDAREQRVTDRLREARAREEEAEQREQEYRREREDFESKRHELLDEAREDVESRRKEWTAELRREIGALRDRWHAEVDRERESFLRDLRGEVATAIVRSVRRAFRDLADSELEERIVDVFAERLRKLDEPDLERLAGAAREAEEPLVVVTTFELAEGQREALREVLEELLEESVELRFAESADLVCGIELRTPSRAVAWSLDAFASDLEERVDEALREAARRGRSSARTQAEDPEPEPPTEDPEPEDPATQGPEQVGGESAGPEAGDGDEREDEA